MIRLTSFLTFLFYVSLPAIMPNSYVLSKPPPDQPVEDWLKWTRSGYERELSASLPTLAAIMGINKAGDIQYLFMPTIIPKAFASDDYSSAIIGNTNNSHSKPSFIHTDTTDLGSVMSLILTLSFPMRYARMSPSRPSFWRICLMPTRPFL